MNEYNIRKQLFISPALVGEDLLVYGIKKTKANFKIITLKETISPEGGEWSFLYDGKLNRLYIEKDGTEYKFTGDISPDLLISLKELFNLPFVP